MEEAQEEAKLQRFLHWLEVNGVELRGCQIKFCGSDKGFGVFSSNDDREGILLIAPLNLAITPMRVLQDPLIGRKCRALFQEGDLDDRFLMMLFLCVERAHKNSTWKPYLDMLPSTFGTPLWFTEDELLELKGTALYKATTMQKKNLQALFDDKVKHLVEELLSLDGEFDSVVHFEDFLWANSIFWTRALNIPFPRCSVYPQLPEQENSSSCHNKQLKVQATQISLEALSDCKDKMGDPLSVRQTKDTEVESTSTQTETIWVEGLVPGIDFCNHDSKAIALWEVDKSGSVTGTPLSMYLKLVAKNDFPADKEIHISYGNKGNEELLYLYGFVVDNNPDDYLMLHYPTEALQQVPCAESKAQLLEIQKAEMRCLLGKSLLQNGFFSQNHSQNEDIMHPNVPVINYSWSGTRKAPSYLNKLVFPENFMTALRTIAMEEDELLQVSSLLEELNGSMEDEIALTEADTCAAIWEVCGDAGALQLLVDLLTSKVMELEEGSGAEAHDKELLENACICEAIKEELKSDSEENVVKGKKLKMTRNRWSAIIYRHGQKELTRLFLKEAEQALHLCLSDQA
ncbi:hypothetical protein AMTRI_Chr09g42690 [Amborella trichopoda]